MVSLFEELESSSDVQERGSYACGRSNLALRQGNAAEALRLAEAALEAGQTMGITQEYVKEAFVVAVQAAFELDDLGKVEELLGIVVALPPGRCPQFLRAHSMRFQGRLADRRGDGDEAE